MSRRFVVVLACVALCGHRFACFAAEPSTIDIQGDRIDFHAGILARTISLASGSAETTSLIVAGKTALEGPVQELSVAFSRAEPNRRPAGLKAGQGGEINSAATFVPGKHVDPARYDDRQLRQAVAWVEPVRLDARAWSSLFAKPRRSHPTRPGGFPAGPSR